MRVIHSRTGQLLTCAIIFLGALHGAGIADESSASSPTGEQLRVSHGLELLFDFRPSEDGSIFNRARAVSGVDSEFRIPETVQQRDGSIVFHRPTALIVEGGNKQLARMVRRTNGLTLEAWLRPDNTKQSGPARIFSFSRDSSNRNFTLGQDGDKYDVRMRTTQTSSNGLPSLTSKSGAASTKLTHIVYTRSRSGKARLYVDGVLNVEKEIGGAFTNWDESYRVIIGDEHGGGRQWLGAMHLIALYSRALSAHEVELNFRAGPDASSTTTEPLVEVDERAVFFEEKIAPLLAHHCLECHDAAKNEGGLDLSQKLTALNGGDSGKAIVSQNLHESLIWERVKNDEMPENRPPLSKEEKRLLQEWIEAGAVFSLDVIDPVIYAHSEGESQHWVRRLTQSEYIASVRVATGVDISEVAAQLLPKDYRADGFSNTAYNLTVDLKHVEAYAKLAEEVVSRMDVVPFADQFAKNHLLIDSNMRDFVSRMGKWVLRGPLDKEEIAVYRGITTTVASAGGDFEDAASFVLEAMLQSPRFLYRIENQRGNGRALPVDRYELANRISYTLWGSPPDQKLFDAAESGALFDPQELDRQIDRMLSDPKAISRSQEFVFEWLNLGRLKNLQPNSERFPDWNPALADDMQAETLAFFEEIVWKQKRPLADLLNAQVTFLTPKLARHYGMTHDGEESLSKHDLSKVPERGGLLTQGSILTIGGDSASMVTRGLFVLHDLLRGIVKDPPPCVDTTPIPTREGLTQRGIALERISNHACGGCHQRFEPLAFGLEKFDGLGTFHENDEYGNPLREDGEFLIPGKSESVEYSTSAELMDMLAESERVKESLTWKLVQFSLGRPLTAADAKTVQSIHRTAMSEGGTYQATVHALIKSDLIQLTQTEADQ
ncbi:Planctomycete cytochrome C [Thalassoglobus neptunius]|uniref:Planctomycete cytochrome C n=1 Tax=Thalassoglobus neptunius TaxID=1938619 RepID=A0A5C5X7U4_9PLAN|nr:DUF1592 domain-containing protein [Thalassoglobus neptunius]TWT58175.1 Planctomycete cytochrome C [Thalassoglobus neptunius]